MRKLLTALLLTALLSTTMALTAAAAPGNANGGREYFMFKNPDPTFPIEVEGCRTGGEGEGGGGGRSVFEFRDQDGFIFLGDAIQFTGSGGGGKGGGGGRNCVTVGDETSCEAGRRDS